MLEQRNHAFLPLTGELLRQVGHPFVVLGAIAYCIVLGRRRITWERAWTGLLLAAFAYRDSFVPADYAVAGERFLPVSAFIRGPPRDLDHIMLQSGQPGLHAFLLDHQWYSGHHAQMRERSRATYSALFASDRESIDALHRDYGVTHLVVPRREPPSAKRRRRFTTSLFWAMTMASSI